MYFLHIWRKQIFRNYPVFIILVLKTKLKRASNINFYTDKRLLSVMQKNI